jgi:CheY-like chemotaxis protein
MLLALEFNREDAREMLEQVKQAALRAADLTRQLLAFSRHAMITPVMLDLNTVVEDLEKMLRRVVKENIRVSAKLSPALRPVKADAGQIAQVLMNLVVNAGDAMPDGGQITIGTANADVDTTFLESNPEARAGPFVRLSVSDTGCGMDEHTKAHIFEPFFTTKAVGKGTGLGLASVFGIVHQAGGWIDVESEPGRGSTFTIYLPQCAPDHRPQPLTSSPAETAGTDFLHNKETVLLVEDDRDLAIILQGALESAGYTVLQAACGQEALNLCGQHSGQIDLLVTDLVMPGLNGRQVSEHVTALRPGIRVLFISGYTDDEQIRQAVRLSGQPFLQKPFTPLDLVRKLREVMGTPGESRQPLVTFSI